MSTAKDLPRCRVPAAGDHKSTPAAARSSPNLTGVRLFKSMVRRVRQRIIAENKLTKPMTAGATSAVAGDSGHHRRHHDRDDDDDFVAKLDELSVSDAGSSANTSPQHHRQRSSPAASKDALRRLFGATRATSDDRLRGLPAAAIAAGGYSSDSGTEKQTRNGDHRVRIRQNLRCRSKSYTRSRPEKKAKHAATTSILRRPPKYVLVRGLSGVTQRVPVC